MTAHAERQFNNRRLHLMLTWADVAKRARISVTTLWRVREGSPVRDLAKAGVESALRWEPGSVDAVLSGGEPTPIEPPQEEPKTDESALRVPEGHVVVSAADLWVALNGPIGDPEAYIAAVRRLSLKILLDPEVLFQTHEGADQ